MEKKAGALAVISRTEIYMSIEIPDGFKALKKT